MLAGEAWPIAEHALAEHARTVGPRGLTKPIHEMAARLDPDGQEPRERELAEPRRELRLTRRQNRVELAGFVDIETGLKLEVLLDTFGKPRSRAANGGEPDARTTAQRYGDDLAATAMEGTRIPAAQIRRIACDATVITKHGKRKRTAAPALRRALIARDQGCAHPDCDAPPTCTQAHHIRYHANGGPATLDNMVLLCAHHHRLIHHTEWSVHIEYGRPRFTAPGYRRFTTAAA